MALTTRVWGLGKFLLIAGGFLATYLLFFVLAVRVTLRSRDVVVPSLIGVTSQDASTALGQIGLTLKVEEGRRIDPKVPADHVVMQEPASGSTARPPRSVKVWLSAGPRALEIPNLIGASDRTAQLRLQSDGLGLMRIDEVRTNEYPTGVVIAQWPAPKARGTDVALLVNRGERGATYVMPDVIGTTGDRAAELLRKFGFRVAVVGTYPYPGIPAGIVLRQNPRSGFQVAPGEAISLEVSR
jgi:eukaryotic-like serine/threonine-protein kinase